MSLSERNRMQLTFALVIAKRRRISLREAIEIISPAFAAQVSLYDGRS